MSLPLLLALRHAASVLALWLSLVLSWPAVGLRLAADHNLPAATADRPPSSCPSRRCRHSRRHGTATCLPAALPLPLAYSIHEIIGRGRQSKVYKARLKQSLEFVVVKACSKDLKPRVLQEVRAGGWGLAGWAPRLLMLQLMPFSGRRRTPRARMQLPICWACIKCPACLVEMRCLPCCAGQGSQQPDPPQPAALPHMVGLAASASACCSDLLAHSAAG